MGHPDLILYENGTSDHRFPYSYLVVFLAVVLLFTTGAWLLNRETADRVESRFNREQLRYASLAAHALEDRLSGYLALVHRVMQYELADLQDSPGELSSRLKGLSEAWPGPCALIYRSGSSGPILGACYEGLTEESAGLAAAPSASDGTGPPEISTIEEHGRRLLARTIIPAPNGCGLTVVLDLNQVLVRHVASVHAGVRGRSWLIDDTGRTLYRSGGDPFPKGLLDTINDLPGRDSGTAVGWAHGPSRGRHLVAWATAWPGPFVFTVVLAAPQAEIDDMLSEFRRQRILLGVFLGLALLGIGLHFFRRREEIRLKASEARYKTLVEGTEAVHYILDETGRIIYVTDSIREMTGYEPAELQGRHFSGAVHEKDLPMVSDLFERLKEDRGVPADFRLNHENGSFVWVRSLTRRVLLHGVMTGFRGVLVDVTEQKEAAQELDFQKKKLESLLLNSGLAIVILGPDVRIQSCNRRFEEVFRLREADIAGADLDEILTGPDLLDESRLLTQRTLAGEPVHETARRLRGDGTSIDVEIFTVPVTIDGQTAGAFGIYRDISDLIRARAAKEEKEALYRTIFETVGAAIFIMRDGRFVDCNPKTSELFGRPVEDIIGRAPFELSPERQPDGRDSSVAAKEHIDRALAGERPVFRWRHLRGETGTFEAEVALARMELADGPCLLAIVRDQTKRLEAERALAENEARYRTILETGGDGYYEVDLAGRFTFFNDNFASLLGYSREQLLGGHYTSFCAEQMAQKAYQAFNNVYREDCTLRGLDWQVVQRDGSVHYCDVTVSLRKDPEGRPVGFRGLARDISDRKQAEEALRRSEEKYRALYENALVGMFRTLLEDGTVIECNEVCARLFGFQDKTDMVGVQHAGSFYVRPEERKAVTKALFSQGRVDSMEVEFRRPNGERFWVNFSAKAFPAEGYAEGTLIDVTGRKRAEAAMRNSERRYQELFDNIGDLILVHDMKGRLIETNPAVLDSLGFTREGVFGRHITDFIVERHRHRFQTEYLEPLIRDGYIKGVSQVKDKSGAEHYIEFRCRVVRPEGQEPYVTGSGRDVTERVRAQRELHEMEEQLRQAGKMEAVGTMASGISHDFNNILQAITGYIHLVLGRGRLDDEDRGHVMEMERAADRAADLVRDLLTFSRRVKPELKPTDLNREVRHAVRLLERTLPRMIEIRVDLGKGLAAINGDPGQLEQIVMNLATNARDAMPEGGQLEIRTLNFPVEENYARMHLGIETGPHVMMMVTDNGLGMDRETSSHIFEPFYTTKGVGRGTGLGLSSVYGIVKAHGGHIECYSRDGKGARFTILFPALSEEKSREFFEDLPRAEIEGGSETVLIVDDEPALLEVGTQVLSANGYKVLQAESGEEALEVYRGSGYRVDLVLLDLGMPGMGGRACLRELKRINPEVRVIVASGYALEERGASSTAGEGGVDYLAKPYKLSGLLLKVREVLDR